MGRERKKGVTGRASKFITRQQAVRKLQISSTSFRTISILKGVYPRVPPKHAKKFAGKVCYHSKDIKFLMVDPLVDDIRARLIWKQQIKHAEDERDKAKII